MFDADKALEIIQREGLSETTLRVWKSRGKIPAIYMEEGDRVSLREVLTADRIDQVIEKYGDEMRRLIDTRKFKKNQKISYYSICLRSLARECETFQKTGKLS